MIDNTPIITPTPFGPLRDGDRRVRPGKRAASLRVDLRRPHLARMGVLLGVLAFWVGLILKAAPGVWFGPHHHAPAISCLAAPSPAVVPLHHLGDLPASPASSTATVQGC